MLSPLPFPLLLAPTLLFSGLLLPMPVPSSSPEASSPVPTGWLKALASGSLLPWLFHPAWGEEDFRFLSFPRGAHKSFKLPHILMGFRSSSHRVRQEWTQKGNWVCKMGELRTSGTNIEGNVGWLSAHAHTAVAISAVMWLSSKDIDEECGPAVQHRCTLCRKKKPTNKGDVLNAQQKFKTFY